MHAVTVFRYYSEGWRVRSCVGWRCYHRVVWGKLWDAQTPASRPARVTARKGSDVFSNWTYRVTREGSISNGYSFPLRCEIRTSTR